MTAYFFLDLSSTLGAILFHDIDRLCRWEKMQCFCHSIQRSTVLSQSIKSKLVLLAYLLKDCLLTNKNTTKYLGVDLHHSVACRSHIHRVSMKGNSILIYVLYVT